ncbi:MAG: serine/threonine-protein kinase [Planctomycetota bacterium]|nr:serine/threonine-protein kinase [Planctomycetota bacterium]
MDAPKLPLPVAVLRRRSHNAKSAKDLHDTAYFAWEVSVRLAVAARPPEDATVLAKASLGAWVGALDAGAVVTSDRALLDVHELLTEVGADRAARPQQVPAATLLGALPAYRNRVIGHGSVRRASFYEHAGRVLLRGIERAWAAGLFLPDSRMVFVESVSVDERGRTHGRVLDLMGDHALVLDAQGTTLPEGTRPGRVYARTGETWRSLFPLVLYAEDDGIERVYLFDAVRGRGARFLDYASGDMLRGKALEARFPGVADALHERIGAWRPDDVTQPIETEDRYGEFELLGEIGRGGMGVVHLARQPELDRLAAVKVLSETLARDDVALARFRREIAALGRSEHPNVIRILGSGTSGDRPYYAMEYVEGVDLAQVARRLETTPDFDEAVTMAWQEVRARHATALGAAPRVDASETRVPVGGDRYGRLALVFRDAARGLHHLHEQGVVHRDIKPGNILITAHGHRAVIMDLGLAALSDASEALTETQGVVGTLRYIAPEQLDPKLGPVDRRADVYALGVTLFELVTGTPFFEGETPAQLIEQVLRATPRRAEQLDRHVPDDLATIVAKATQRDPRRRYGDAATLAADLDAFLGRRPIAARAPTLGYVLRLAVRRHKPIAAAVLLLLAVAVGGTVLFMKHLGDTGREETRLREAAEASGQRAKDLAEVMLLELSRYPDAPETSERVEDFAPAVFEYFGQMPLDGLTDAELARHHQAFDWVARALESRQRFEGALRHRRRTRELLEEHRRRHPGDAAKVPALASSWLSEGDVLEGAGRLDEAKTAWARGLAIARELDLDAMDEQALTNLGNQVDAVADTLVARQAYRESADHRAVFAAMLEAMSRRRPTRWNFKDMLIWCRENQGDALVAAGEREQAFTAWEQAQDVRRERMRTTPGDAAVKRDFYDRESMIAEQLVRANRRDEALPRFERAIEGGKKIVAAQADDADVREWLAAIHDSFGSLLQDLGREADGQAQYDAAIRLRK